MDTQAVTIEINDVRKLLGAASADAALLYIYLKSGGVADNAGPALNMSGTRVGCAMATLRQLGLCSEQKQTRILAGERPSYTEQDVLAAAGRDNEFDSLRGEVQRLLGRNLNVEELKILLSFIRYLGLPVEVVSMLVSYCKERARLQGKLRNPSLRTIEKEAYYWAEQGIDSMEEAAAFIQAKSARNSRMGRMKEQLQIRGRALTAAEERYAQSWMEMGFSDEAIAMAYERTCLNTGGLNWNYMNRILQRWHEAGLHTGEEISNERRPGSAPRSGQRRLDEDERAAIERMLSEV